MTYEVFLTTFDRVETAGEAASWLHEWVRKGELQLLDVIVLAKRADGSALTRENGDLGSQHGERIGAILGGLLGAPAGPAAVAVSATGAAVGAAGELLASRDFYHDDLKEFEQALTPGASALLALLVPENAASYAHRIADFGGETLCFSMSSDAGQEFQDAKHAFIARQSERRRQQLAAWSSTTAEENADLDVMNRVLAQLYATISRAPERQADLRVHAAALRTRRDAARQLRNQTLVAAIQRLDEEIVNYQQALSRATSEGAHAALAAEYETLLGSRVAAEQQLAASQDAELHERWRHITALQTLATRADPASRITLDMQLAELRERHSQKL